LDQNDPLEQIPTGVLTGPEQYALIKNATLGGEDSQKHQNILKTYRNTVKTSGLVSPLEIIPPNLFQIFKTQDAAMATKTNLKTLYFCI